MPLGKRQSTLELIDACTAILREIRPASVRAVCYQLFNRKLIASMAKNDTKRVSEHLTIAREEGVIPWSWIVDHTRQHEYTAVGWDGVDDFMDGMATLYHRNPWAMQPQRVVIWSEKSTVSGMLAPVLRRLGVQFFPCHGFNSATKTYEAAQSSVGSTKPLVLLYVGDHDPSGRFMSDVDLQRRLTAYGGALTLTRVALTQEDCDQLDPAMSFPPKPTDSCTPWFVRHYGQQCWELDAMSPVALRARVEAAITAHIDPDLWQQSRELEVEEQLRLRAFFERWSG